MEIQANVLSFEVTNDLRVDLPALTAHFPSIRADILARAVAHHLAPHELPKLQEADTTKSLAEAASSLEALVPLLRQYFDVLAISLHLRTVDVNPGHFHAYITQLAGFAKGHAWDAVLEYHLAFHGKRLVEMGSACAGGGDARKVTEACASWAVIDDELCAKFLQGGKNLKTKNANDLEFSWGDLCRTLLFWALLFYVWRWLFGYNPHATIGRLTALELEVSSMKSRFQKQAFGIADLVSENALLRAEVGESRKPMRQVLDRFFS